MMLDLSRGVVALHGDDVVGTAMATLFGEDTATINTIIVEKSLQGRGLGRRLLEEVMAIAAGRELRLVATESGLPLYKKFGFRITSGIHQHQGIVVNLPAVGSRGEWEENPEMDVLRTIDLQACGMDRSRLLEMLIDVGKVAVVRDHGRIRGFAILRDFGRGKVAGPVVCDDLGTAKTLLAFVFASQPETFMRVDCPDDSGLSDWLSDLGLIQVDAYVCMKLNPKRDVEDSGVRTFAMASQALG